jgi:hypothetical protein
MSRSSSIAPLLALPQSTVSVESIKANGDCFYSAVVRALGEGAGHTVKSLRQTVADRCSQDTFDTMRSLCAAGLDDFRHMRSIPSLEEMKRRLGRTARQAGIQNVLWADEFAVQTVADAHRLTFLVASDARGRGRGRSRSGHGHEFITVRPSGGADAPPARHVLLHRTRRAHYNLIRLEGRVVHSEGELRASLPAHVLTRWLRPLGPRARGPSEPDASEPDASEPDGGRARKRRKTSPKDAEHRLRQEGPSESSAAADDDAEA